MRNQDLTLFTTPLPFLRRFTDDMQKFFDNFGAAQPFPPTGLVPEAGWMPNVDIVEKDGVLALRADLPGLTTKDVTVEVDDDMLTIKGERKTDIEEKKDGVYRRERTFGSFYRAFPLPEGAKADQIKASFANGVLEVTVPIPAAAKTIAPRKIDVMEATPQKAKSAA